MDKEIESLQSLYVQKKMVSPGDTQQVKKEGANHLKKLKDAHLKTVFVFVATAAAIWYADHVSATKLTTSVTGFWIMISCALYYAASRLYLLRQLNAISPAQPALRVMEQLGAYKKLNNFFATYGEMVYVVILSIGVYLYLMPILLYMTTTIPVKFIHLLKFIWFIYIGWALVHTFYVKRKRMKAETVVIDNYIQLLKAGE